MALSGVLQGLFSCLTGPRKGSADFEASPPHEVKPSEEATQGGRHQTVCNYSNNIFLASHDGDLNGTYHPAIDMGTCKPLPSASNPSANAGDADIIATSLHDSGAANYGEDCSLDSLICASVPSAITVFTVSGFPVHQNPTSVLHLGNRVRQQRSGSDGANISDTTFLMEVFEYEPEKLERMIYEVMREGGGQWKGVIRIPARLLVSEHGAMGSVCNSPLPWQASHVSKMLPNASSLETASLAVSTPPEGPRSLLGRHRQRRGNQTASAGGFEGDEDADSDPDSYPELRLESFIMQGPGIDWARSKIYSTSTIQGKQNLWPDTLGLRPGGCLRPSLNLRARPGLNAAQLPDRASFDNHDAVRWRLAAGRSRLSLAGDAAGAVPTAVAFSGSATPPTYTSLTSSLHVRQYVGPALKGQRAGSLPSGGSGGVPGVDGDVEECQSYSRCSNPAPTRDCIPRPTSINVGTVASMPLSPGAASSPPAYLPSYRAAHGTHAGYSKLSTIFQRPNCRSASFSHTSAAESLDEFTGADGSCRHRYRHAHSHAHMLSQGYSHSLPPKPVCALGFELGNIPEPAAANAFGHPSMGWEAGGNPLATSTFGLALGGTLDGLQIAATPLYALATVISNNNNRRSRSGGMDTGDQVPYLPPRCSLDTYLTTTKGLLESSPVSAGCASIRRPASANLGSNRKGGSPPLAPPALVTVTGATNSTLVTAAAAEGAAATGVLSGVQGSAGSTSAANTTSAQATDRTRGILRRTTSAAAVAPVWQHAGSVRQGGTTGTGNLSRVLTFASSLKNAPAATQMLAEGSRHGSFGSRSHRSRSCVGMGMGVTGGVSTAPVVPSKTPSATQRAWESADEAKAVQRALAEQMAEGGDEHEAGRLPYMSYNNSSINVPGTDSVREEVVGEHVGSTGPDNEALLLLSASWLETGTESLGGGGAHVGVGGGRVPICVSGEVCSLQCATKEAAANSTSTTTYNTNHMSTEPPHVTSTADAGNPMSPFTWATATAMVHQEMGQLLLSSAPTGSGSGPAAGLPVRSASSSPFLRVRGQQAVCGSGGPVSAAVSTGLNTATPAGANRPNNVHRLGRSVMTTGGYISVGCSSNISGPPTDFGVQQGSGQQVLGRQDEGKEPLAALAQINSAPPAFAGLPSAASGALIAAPVTGATPSRCCNCNMVSREASAICRNSDRERGLQATGRGCEQCAQSQVTLAITEGSEEGEECQTARFFAQRASLKCNELRDGEQRKQPDCEQADPVAQAAAAAAAAAGNAAGAAALPSGGEGVVSKRGRVEYWHEVTLLFADIKGFTPMCKQVPPRTVMTMLNDLYSRFDAMLDRYGVFKVETIGDCYFVAGGLVHEDEDGMSAVTDGRSKSDPLHAQKVFMFAKAMLSAAREVKLPTTGEPVQIRVGISSGPVVSGVVGTRMPRFCLFGDTVNTTSRMESTGVPGAIHASASAHALLRSEAWEPTGGIEVKGKGLMQTFLWRPLVNDEDGEELKLPTCATEAAVAAAKATATGMSTQATLLHTTTETQSSGAGDQDRSSATLARQPTTPDCLEVLTEADFRGDNPSSSSSCTDKPSGPLRGGGGERIEN